LGIPGVTYLKPDSFYKNLEIIKQADVILFPEYWQVNTLVYGLKKQIFPSINSYHLGHDKVEMTRVLQAVFPENVPYTRIIASSPQALEEIKEEFYFPLVAKEVRNSMGQGVYLIQDEAGLKEYARNNEVLYVQEKLPVDRDLRVVYAGSQVLTAYWRIAAEGSFHNNIARGASFSFDDVPPGALELVAHIAETLGINHAGFDVAVVGDRYYIFEFNILFGNDVINQNDIPLKETIYSYIIKNYSSVGQ
jgi:ribosomal protein S6--L-glutamate ligase